MCSWHHLSVIDYVVCLNADVGDAVMFVFWFYLWANPSEKIMFPWNHLNAWQIPGIRYFLQKIRAGLVYSVFVYLGRFQKRWRIVIFLYISVQCQWQIQGLSLCIAEMALVSFEVRNQNQNFLFFQGRGMCWLNILRMHCKKVYTVTTVGNGYMSVWSWRGVHGLQTTCDYFEPKFISSTNNWAKTRKTDKTSFSTIGFLF